MPWKWKSSSVCTRLDKGLGSARQRYATLCLHLAEVFKHYGSHIARTKRRSLRIVTPGGYTTKLWQVQCFDVTYYEASIVLSCSRLESHRQAPSYQSSIPLCYRLRNFSSATSYVLDFVVSSSQS